MFSHVFCLRWHGRLKFLHFLHGPHSILSPVTKFEAQRWWQLCMLQNQLPPSLNERADFLIRMDWLTSHTALPLGQEDKGMTKARRRSNAYFSWNSCFLVWVAPFGGRCKYLVTIVAHKTILPCLLAKKPKVSLNALEDSPLTVASLYVWSQGSGISYLLVCMPSFESRLTDDEFCDSRTIPLGSTLWQDNQMYDQNILMGATHILLLLPDH